MKNKKFTTILALTLITAMAVTSCAENADKKRKKKTDETDKEPQQLVVEVDTTESANSQAPDADETSNTIEETIETTAPADPVDYSYEEAYIEVINNFNNYAEYATDGSNRKYDLIFVDDDNIPELVVEDGICMVYLFSYADGEIHTIMDGWPYGAGGNHGYTYGPYTNLIENINSDYAGGCYWIWYGHISENHELVDDPVSRHSQAFPEGTDDVWSYLEKWDGESWYYYLDNNEVTKEEYEASLYPDVEIPYMIMGNYSYDEIMYYLNNETTPKLRTSSDYEIIVQDCTWSEAQAICESKGGHLATPQGEVGWWGIQDLIREDDSGAFAYYVGGTYSEANGGYIWSADNSNLPVGDYFWRAGEPSLSGKTEDGRTVDENRMCVLATSNNGYKTMEMIDVPDDILDAAPSYSGKVAFICEYDKASR